MSSVDRLATDRITIRKRNGREIGPYKAIVSDRSTIMLFEGNADVEEGDDALRRLPNGRTETYRVLESHFSPGHGGIPATYNLRVRKASLPDPPARGSITINHAQAVQIGDANTQTITLSFQSLVQAIESHTAADSDKAEARSRLRALLEHPLVAAVVGPAAAAILASLGS